MSIARNSATTLIAQVTSLALGMVASIVVSRMLGPHYRGIYFLVGTTTALMLSLGNLGLDFTNTYLMAKGRYSLRQLNSNSMMFALAISAFALVVYFLARDLLQQSVFKEVEEPFILYAFLMLPLALYTRYWGCMMLGLNRIWLVNRLQIVTEVVGIGSTLLVVAVFQWGIWGLLAQAAVFNVVLTAVRLFIVWKIDGLEIGVNLPLLKESLHFGLRGQIGNVAGAILIRADSYIVNYFGGVTAVGYYSLASSLAEKLYFLTSPITTAVNPIVTRSPLQEATMLTSKVLRHCIPLVSLGAVALIVVSPWLVPLLYGNEFLPTVGPLPILALGIIPETVALIIGVYVTGQLGKPEVGSLISWVVLLVFIPLALYLTGVFGFVGTATALSIAYLVNGLVHIVLFKAKSGQSFRDFLLIRRADIALYFKTLGSLTRWLSRLRVGATRWRG